jgi:hypothetical protein
MINNLVVRTTVKRCAVLFVSCSILVLTSSGGAVQDKKPPKKGAATFTNAAEAGPDFLVQGEYEGAVGKATLGAQVVARGDGKFDVYFLTGGLPGARWDTKGRFKADAKSESAKTTVQGKGWQGVIADGKLTGTGPEGPFSLQRVERKSPTLGAKPPQGAIILFDGTKADEWGNGKIVEDNLLFCGTSSKRKLGAGKLHIEFRTPFQPKAGGQGRGNSGVYIQGKEIQVLDSFGLEGKNNECGAFYGQAKPAVNMCFPPLSWQTYDVEVREQNGKTLATVWHNGVKVHDNFMVRNGPPTPTSISLQNHGNPVVYRNIWFVEHK